MSSVAAINPEVVFLSLLTISATAAMLSAFREVFGRPLRSSSFRESLSSRKRLNYSKIVVRLTEESPYDFWSSSTQSEAENPALTQNLIAARCSSLASIFQKRGTVWFRARNLITWTALTNLNSAHCSPEKKAKKSISTVKAWSSWRHKPSPLLWILPGVGPYPIKC